MVLPFGIEEIQRSVVDANHLGEGIAAEVHDGFDCAGLQVDVVQGAETVVDKDGVEFLTGGVDQDVLFPAAVRHHLASPVAVLVEGERVAIQLVAFGVEDEGLVVDKSEEIEPVVDGIDGGIYRFDEIGLPSPLYPSDASCSFLVLNVVEQYWLIVMAEDVSVIT